MISGYRFNTNGNQVETILSKPGWPHAGTPPFGGGQGEKAMKFMVWIVFAAMLSPAAGAAPAAQRGNAMKQGIDAGVIKLPEPSKEGALSVTQALAGRRSTRSFADRPLTRQDVAQLLWAAQGITDPKGFRTAPSAGALFPLEVYVAAGNVEGLAQGLYHYRAASHDLVRVGAGDHRLQIAQAALNQGSVRDAPALFLFACVFTRTTQKYGRRGMQYVFMEAGHAAQNLMLQAESMGLGHVAIGAFNDEALGEIMKLGEQAHPLYILPVGHR
jgi:SagB-type dehydrogenase family enzyme